jgi:hypothetical protein
MLAFSFQTVIADVDETVEGEPFHPALVLLLELDEDFIRVVLPDAVLSGRRELLAVDRSVQVAGEVRDSPYGPVHVATELRLLNSGH